MNRIEFIIVLLFVCVCDCYSQNLITRNELLKLYYEASVAVRDNNEDLAVKKYKEIIDYTPFMAEPYLHLAHLYEKNIQKEEYMNATILMYRKYVDLELDETKRDRVKKRLYELEDKIKSPHFMEYSEEKGYQPADIEEIPILTKEEIVAIPLSTTEQIAVNKQKDITSIKEIDNNASDLVVEKNKLIIIPDTGIVDGYNVNLSEDLSRSYEQAMIIRKIEVDDLCGRWVSSSRLGNGRETWILDINYVQNKLRVTINKLSGIYMVKGMIPDDPSNQIGGTFGERLTLLGGVFGNTQVTNSVDKYFAEDIRYETMVLFSSLEAETVEGGMNEDKLDFIFKINRQYNPSNTKYDVKRELIGNLSSQLPSSLGWLGFIAKVGVNQQQENDRSFNISGDINFQLNTVNSGLVGTCNEVIYHTSADGVKKEKTNRVFDCFFYKVSENYAGAEILNEKNDEQLDIEEKALEKINKEYKKNVNAAFCKGIAEQYNLGERGPNKESQRSMKYFLRAAKKGHIDAMKIITKMYYELSVNQNYSNGMRRKYLQNAEEWNLKLKGFNEAASYNIVASHYLKYEPTEKYDISMKLYRNAAQLGDSEAMLSLAKILINSKSENEKMEGVKYLQQSVNKKNMDAVLYMSQFNCYNNNMGAYLEWLKKALKYGNTEALRMLSVAYMQGVGVQQDYVMANKYFIMYFKDNSNLWMRIFKKYNFY